jgi:hypothetical protein
LILAKCKLIYENKITRYFSANIQRKGKYLHQDCSIRIASAVDVGTIFRKTSCNSQGCDKKLCRQSFKTEYFLVIVDGALIAITTRFAKMNENSDNFCFLHESRNSKI